MILYKIRSIKLIIFNKNETNLKTTISQRDLRNSSLLLLLFEFNNFSLLIDIIDNIYAPETCHQNSNQWQCSIIVTCLRPYHVTSILHDHWREILSWFSGFSLYPLSFSFTVPLIIWWKHLEFLVINYIHVFSSCVRLNLSEQRSNTHIYCRNILILKTQ